MLETTIGAQPVNDSVTFTLRVENRGDDDVELSFSDSQRARVSVCPAEVGDDIDPIWRSDAGQMYMQVLGSETVPAGGSLEFREVWEEPESGTYLASGEVICRDRELRGQTTFSV